ncbi:UDP-glucose/GDP-mannose dehydrogenase family protein [Pseudarthrobacter sp. AL07]|uniref:UDP-glucose dehydrogenase family protein n=1 Tax=unclassified Pseudarthrobacter TaxID=2647000 RepID=UPI00249BF631|nr:MULTISPECIES: UDP-glucose/GDP-mannose dehydrogenase family protein [unclassified Pseudarthrobacter]MDI3193557.1 UDP-glucose/GDP-mannose dehydrogenase family protein [Pseudarthrobacter sp. AL20]MDI3207626.1 UDP-glucose/GDP-mannose dehydrogenase family protein [Pseudarthrobacter sp. AL07]
MKISVIGCGYLGAVHAATLASMGHTVVGIDVDAAKVDQLGRGLAPFFEPGLDELLRDGRCTGRLTFSTDVAAAAGAQVHFLCVGTPQSKTSDGADLTFLVAATEALLPHLARGAVVVGKSTVPVGTVDMVQGVLAGRPDVKLGWNPEFLRQGTAVKDSLVPDRLVYGVAGGRTAAFNPRTGAPRAVTAALDAVYEPLLNAGIPRLVCNFATAELIKSAANAFLATKVSFINAISELCDASGADVAELSEAMGMDPRIGNRYMHAGLGFGGGCLPKDIRSLRSQAAALGVDPVSDWMGVVDSVNVRQRTRTVSLAGELCGGALSGRAITILGASFKPETDDIRDSPALDVAARLAAAGAHVTVTDPKAVNHAWLRYPQLRFEASATRALEGAELVLLLTEWDEYRRLSPAVAADLVRRRVILDARNVLDVVAWQAEGWVVRGLGTNAGASVVAGPVGGARLTGMRNS